MVLSYILTLNNVFPVGINQNHICVATKNEGVFLTLTPPRKPHLGLADLIRNLVSHFVLRCDTEPALGATTGGGAR